MGIIYLIGFMGCGKSTFAKAVSIKTGYPVAEMDEEIEKRFGMPITDIFEKFGENTFRKAETELLEEYAKTNKDIVVSCGGGTVMKEENVALMKKGMVIFLNASPNTIFEHVRYSNNRPILNGNMNIAFITDLMNKRRPYYEKAADHVVITDNKSKDQIINELTHIILNK